MTSKSCQIDSLVSEANKEFAIGRENAAFSLWESAVQEADDDLSLCLFVRHEFSIFCMSKGYEDRSAELDKEICLVLGEGIDLESGWIDDTLEEILRQGVEGREVERAVRKKIALNNIPSSRLDKSSSTPDQHRPAEPSPQTLEEHNFWSEAAQHYDATETTDFSPYEQEFEDATKSQGSSNAEKESFPCDIATNSLDPHPESPAVPRNDDEGNIEEANEETAEEEMENRVTPGSPLGFNLETKDGRADYWFQHLQYNVHTFVEGQKKVFQNAEVNGKRYQKIRIAVLDTGFEKNIRTRAFSSKVTAAVSFLEAEREVEDWTDEADHGTAVVYQLTRVCPNAQIYMCRVAKKKGNEWVADPAAVVRAIKKACSDDWAIDIINMSFGWSFHNHAVEDALSDAQKKGILLFASVSNFGIMGCRKVLYPARSQYVIPADSADGYGNSSDANSSAMWEYDGERFTAPGEKVKGPGANDRRSGTSFASPIATGIAALVLEFALQYPLGADENILRELKRKNSMVMIFRRMSEQKGAERFKFLKPWLLLGVKYLLLKDDDGRYGGDGKPKSARHRSAETIIEVLREEYGPHIGKIILED